MGDGYQEVQEVISIHAPTRGATSLKATEYKLSIDFNPRSHERSDRAPLSKCTRPHNFNPRSHERSDVNQTNRHAPNKISIHAPTRGATLVKKIKQKSLPISIHAPTRGATIFPQML